MQIHQIFSQDTQFPDSLRQISNSPASIYALGKIPDQPMIAIVGTRKYTSYGKAVTYQLASELARAGITIVSGLAIGIDGIAHRAALDAGGKTIAVLANGLDSIYPPSHRNLAIEILDKGGALISEYEVGTPPMQFRFPERNRIVVGLSEGVIITESAAEGGSMITAGIASDENRILMAVPGDILRESSAGPNNLIRTGKAAAITTSTDVYEALGIPPELIPATEIFSARSPHEARVLELLGQGINTTEQLIEHSQLTAAQFAGVISLMEITGKVRNLGAGLWAKRGASLKKVKT